MTRVSIVIPAFNAEKTLARTLEASFDQDYTIGALEVILVDDGSTDKTGCIAQSYIARGLKYIYQDNGGPAKARNTGWKASSGDIVCFTDADCIPAKDWVSRLLEGYTAEEIGAVGGTYDIVNGNKLLPACIHEEIRERHLRMPRNVNYLGSFNLSCRKRVLIEVGGFDESFTRASGEDNDLSYRIIQKGYRLIFVEQAKVAHCYPERLHTYLKQQLVHGYWRVKLHRKHPHTLTGDVYSGIFDYIQPPLFLLILLLLPFIFIYPVTAAVCMLLLAMMIVQLPFALRVVTRTGDKKYLLLMLITFLRGFYRSVGLLLGMLRFILFGSLQHVQR